MMQQMPWPEIYERELVPAIFKPWSFTTVASVEPELGEHVLDVACGTGVVTRRVARYVGAQGRVVGLDLNADMLAFARSLPIPSNVIIEWVQGNALLLPFSETLFDIVLCQGGLQFIDDRLMTLREMHRVLKPGARLAVQLFNDLQSVSAFALLARTIEAYVDPLVVEHIMAPFSLEKAEAMSLLRDAGFKNIVLSEEMKMARFRSAEHFVHSCLAGSRIRNSMSEETLDRAIHEGSAALHSYEVNGELVFPMVGYILVAHKD